MKLHSIFIALVTIFFANSLFGQKKNNLSFQDVLSLNKHYNPIESRSKILPRIELRNKKYISIDSVIFFGKDEPRTLIEYSFNTSNNTESTFYFSYNDNGFTPRSYFQFDFNTENILHNITYCKPWDGNYDVPGNNEINWTRRATYNEDNKVKFYSYYLPLEDGEEFLLNEYDHIYNSEGLLSELHYYSYDVGEWKLTDLQYYNYENKSLVEVIDKVKDSNNNWITKDSTSYKYYPDDKLKSITVYYSKNLGFNENFNVEYLYEYNDQNQLIGDHEYRNSENDDGEKRVTRFLTYHNYDSFGNLILSKNYSSFNLIDSVIGSEEHYSYILDFTTEETRLPKPNAFFFNEDILNRSPIYPIKTYEKYGYEQGENRGLEDREEYFYSDISTSTQEINLHNLGVKVSPNPSQDFVQLHFDNVISFFDVTIFDLNGHRIVDINNYSSGDKINIDALEPGVYFYRVNHRDGNASGQFVKL